MTERLYYIRNMSARGDIALWWRPNGRGYTTHVAEAGLYTETEARSIHDGRGEDVALAKELVEANTFVAMGSDRANSLAPAWPKKPPPPPPLPVLPARCTACDWIGPEHDMCCHDEPALAVAPPNQFPPRDCPIRRELRRLGQRSRSTV